jgi:hypothetical protein
MTGRGPRDDDDSTSAAIVNGKCGQRRSNTQIQDFSQELGALMPGCDVMAARLPRSVVGRWGVATGQTERSAPRRERLSATHKRSFT